MTHLFHDTLTCNAGWYLNECGDPITREEFIATNQEWHGVMLYVGGGFCPLQIAVLTADARGYHQPDWGTAVSAFEEWCRDTDRGDEIGETAAYIQSVQDAVAAGGHDLPDVPEYELMIQNIPAKVKVDCDICGEFLETDYLITACGKRAHPGKCERTHIAACKPCQDAHVVFTAHVSCGYADQQNEDVVYAGHAYDDALAAIQEYKFVPDENRTAVISLWMRGKAFRTDFIIGAGD
jgi:hypothetical protein